MWSRDIRITSLKPYHYRGIRPTSSLHRLAAISQISVLFEREAPQSHTSLEIELLRTGALSSKTLASSAAVHVLSKRRCTLHPTVCQLKVLKAVCTLPCTMQPTLVTPADKCEGHLPFFLGTVLFVHLSSQHGKGTCSSLAVRMWLLDTVRIRKCHVLKNAKPTTE